MMIKGKKQEHMTKLKNLEMYERSMTEEVRGTPRHNSDRVQANEDILICGIENCKIVFGKL